MLLMTRMVVMLMGRVRNQMSAELLEVGPGAGQIEPSATGAHGVQQHTAQQPIWNQSLNIHCCNLLRHTDQHNKIHKQAVVAGAICEQNVCVQLTLVQMCGHLIEGQSALTSTIFLTLHFRRQQDGPKICRTQQVHQGTRVRSDMLK